MKDSTIVQLTVNITQVVGMEGELLVEAEGKVHGERLNRVVFGYPVANPALVADLEIAGASREAYRRLREQAAVGV